MDWQLLLEAIFGPGLFTSATLGFMVGAFYGFPVIGDQRLAFPAMLWSVGLAFVVSLGLLAASGETPFSFETNLARGILWTVLCLCIPAGRWIRLQLEGWRIRRRTKKLEE